MISLLGLNFHLYGLLIGVAIITALVISKSLAQKKGVDVIEIERLSWWVIILGVIGARTYHVINYWQDFYSRDVIQVIYIWKGGLGIWGAIAGGVMGLFLFYKQKSVDRQKTKFWALTDIAFIGLPVAQALGRLGNFFNQELLGRETGLPWGLLIDGKFYHPLFLYEGLLNLILFTLLWKLKNKKNGTISGGYLIGYGLIRFFLEWLRPENISWKWAGLPMASIWGLAAIFTGGIIIWQSQRQPS